jgi:hypothetical protein
MSTKVAIARPATIEVKIGIRKVKIEIPSEVKAYVFDVLIHDDRKDVQNEHYRTLMTLLAAAYRAGQKSN